MRTLKEWLSLYGESHQNRTNKLIHYLCVPAIFFTVLAILSYIPMPLSSAPVWLNWATIFMIPALVFYFMLSAKIGVIMTIISASMLLFIVWWQISLPYSLLTFAIGIFVVGWILQFVGHKIEGKKPSFFNDLQFLLIGPAWIIAELFSVESQD